MTNAAILKTLVANFLVLTLIVWLPPLNLKAQATGAVATDQACPAVRPSASRVKRVLLLSLDGMHALDLANYVKARPNSSLAQLSQHGITYTNAHSSLPSNSWPGLLAMVTGGSPLSTGVIFENSYDRSLSPPGSSCKSVGTAVVYDSSIDNEPNAPDGGGINPKKLPLNPAKNCNPVYPHEYVRVNNIFEVIKQAGGRTAWADKHPAYEFLNGPSGQGVDDLFTPEIRMTAKARSIPKMEAYDDTKVEAILNQIDGKDHTGTRSMGVPEIFGMNFQAISMAQKMKGFGYLDGEGTPSAGLLDALDHTDQSIGRITGKLKEKKLLESTLIIVTAKHGDVPIDPLRFRAADLSLIPKIVQDIAPGLLLNAEQDGSIAMLWLKDHRHTADVVEAIRKQQIEAGIQQIFSGESLKLMFADPATDSRMPDIVIQPNLGVIYVESDAGFIEEHGGFTDEDTHVALLVSLPGFLRCEIKSPVHTNQIAPTILVQLGLNPESLEAVVKEMTPSLPVLGPMATDDTHEDRGARNHTPYSSRTGEKQSLASSQ
jgi:type I phosphodiesterase/nucleotide pyrophosphatase